MEISDLESSIMRIYPDREDDINTSLEGRQKHWKDSGKGHR